MKTEARLEDRAFNVKLNSFEYAAYKRL